MPRQTANSRVKKLSQILNNNQSLKYQHFTFELSIKGFINIYTLILVCAGNELFKSK